MTAREYLAFPIALLGWLCEGIGGWLGHKLIDLSEWVAGPKRN